MERFARFFGYDGRAAFARDLLGHLNIVQGHYGKLFEGDPTGTAKLPAADYSAGPDDPRLLEHLATLGFKKPVMVAETVRQWMAGDYRVFRSEATRNAFVEFVPALIDGLAHAEEPDSAVTAFDRFLQALQRGGRLISLLSQNRDLVALVALILGAAPRLGDMLARQPQIMDGLIDPRFFGAMPDQRELSARLAATLADANSYEEFLDRLRLFGQESLFLIGTRILSGTVSAQQASVAFADVAEGIVHTVHGLVTDRFAAQHGRIREQQTAIVAMGRLGSREMTASSDLDLILLYDFDPEQPDSDGRAFAARRALFRALHPAADQRLHDADQLRRALRGRHAAASLGAGRAGGLAHRILRRIPGARGLDLGTHGADPRAGDFGVARLSRQNRKHHPRRADAAARRGGVATDVAEMRRAIALEKGEDDVWDLKYAAGGMVDIDFIAQYLQLVHAAAKPDILDVSTLHVLDNAARLGVLPQSAAEILRSATHLYHDLTQILRLCVSENSSRKARAKTCCA